MLITCGLENNLSEIALSCIFAICELLCFYYVIYLQTKETQAREDSRLSRAKEDKRRTKCHPTTTGSGTKEASRLKHAASLTKAYNLAISGSNG